MYQAGWRFYGDTSEFTGTYYGCDRNGWTRDSTRFFNGLNGQNASWTVGHENYSNNDVKTAAIGTSGKTYKFGKLTSTTFTMCWFTDCTVEVGEIANGDSTVTCTQGALYDDSNTFRKVGETSTCTLNLSEAKGAVEVNAGTLTLTGSGPTSISMTGNTALLVLGDSLSTTIASVVKDSTATIAISNATDHTFTKAFEASNAAGITKTGSGVLTLALKPAWTDNRTITVVQGALIVADTTFDNYTLGENTVIDTTYSAGVKFIATPYTVGSDGYIDFDEGYLQSCSDFVVDRTAAGGDADGYVMGSRAVNGSFTVSLNNATAGDYLMTFKDGIKDHTASYTVTVTDGANYTVTRTYSMSDLGNWLPCHVEELALKGLPAGKLTLTATCTAVSADSNCGNFGYFKFVPLSGYSVSVPTPAVINLSNIDNTALYRVGSNGPRIESDGIRMGWTYVNTSFWIILNVSTEGSYRFSYMYGSDNAASTQWTLVNGATGEQVFISTDTIESTGGFETTKTVTHDLTNLAAGVYELKVVFLSNTSGSFCGDIGSLQMTLHEARIGKTSYGTLAEAIAEAKNGDTITLNTAITESATYNIAEGVTLDTAGHTMANATITGAGAVIYNGAIPGTTEQTGYQASAWTGTVWIKNKTASGNVSPSLFGNASSTVKYTNVVGWFVEGSFGGTVVLEDGSGAEALKLDNGFGNKKYTIATLKGTGTLNAYWSKNMQIAVTDVSGFSGTITCRTGGMGVCLGSAVTGSSGTITVADGTTFGSSVTLATLTKFAGSVTVSEDASLAVGVLSATSVASGTQLFGKSGTGSVAVESAKVGSTSYTVGLTENNGYVCVSSTGVTPHYWYEFNGDFAKNTGVANSLTFGDANVNSTKWIPTAHGKAAETSASVSPYFNNCVALGADQDWTIAAFARTINSANGAIWSLGNNSAGGIALVSDGADGIKLGTFNSKGFVGTNGSYIVKTNLKASMQYHLYVAVKSGSNLKLYVDGTAVDETGITYGAVPNTKGQFGGVNGGIASMRANGTRIDDWKLYKSALTADQITALAASYSAWPTYSTPLKATVTTSTTLADIHWYDGDDPLSVAEAENVSTEDCEVVIEETGTITIPTGSTPTGTKFKGMGRVIYTGALPGVEKADFVDANNWTGTVEIANYTTTGYFNPSYYGNAKSTVCLNGVSAIPLCLPTTSSGNWAKATQLKALEIGAGGLTMTASFSASYGGLIPADLIGSGAITCSTSGGNNTYAFAGDPSSFTGSIVVGSGMASVALVKAGTTAAPVNLGSKIYIGEGVSYKLTAGTSLVAPDGITVVGTLDLNGQTPDIENMTVTGALANSGAAVTLTSKGGSIDLSSATSIADNISFVVDLATVEFDDQPFVFSDATKYASVTTTGTSDLFQYNTTTGKIERKPLVKHLADKLLWLPIGDSITEGEQYMGHPDQGDVNTRGGYRYQVWTNLVASGQATRSVGYRTGHQGTVEDPTACDWAWHAAQYGGVIMHDNTGTHGAAGFNVENTLEAAGYPDVITVLMGVNDLSFSGDAAKVYETMSAMVTKLSVQRPKSKIIVSTLLPAGGGRSYITTYNTLLRNHHTAGDAPFDCDNVVFLDVNQEAFDGAFEAGYFKGDNLHPNETGAKKVGAVFAEKIAEIVEAKCDAAVEMVEVNNATTGKVSVRFSKALGEVTAATLTISGKDVDGTSVSKTYSSPTISTTDARVLEFTCNDTLVGGTYTATLTGVSGTDGNEVALPEELSLTDSAFVNIQGTGAAANVPKAYRDGFKKYQTITVSDGTITDGIGAGDNYGGTGPSGSQITTESGFTADESVSRVGYYMELQRAGQAPQFVWVSMDADAFGDDIDKVGIPTTANGNFKAIVRELEVYGKRGNFTNTEVLSDGQVDATQTGIIEFSPWTWTAADQSGYATDFHAGKFGWNDTLSTATLQGCMQVARIIPDYDTYDDYTAPAAEMLFAYNNFNCDWATDLGIGSFSTHHANAGGDSPTPVYDWTNFTRTYKYTKFAVNAYTVKKIEIWVQHVDSSEAVASIEIGGKEVYFRTLRDAIDAAEGAEIKLIQNCTNAPEAGQDYPAANINVNGKELTFLTSAADQVISVTNLTGAGTVVVASGTTLNVGAVSFGGTGASFTGTIEVKAGGTLIADCGTPWGTSATVDVFGTLAIAHGGYQNNISLANVKFEPGSTYYVIDSAAADGYIEVSSTFASGSSNAVPALVEADYDPVTVEVTYSRANDLDTFSYTPEVSGAACRLDYTFTNTVQTTTSSAVAQSSLSELKAANYNLTCDSGTKANYVNGGEGAFTDLALTNRPYCKQTCVPDDRAVTVATIGTFAATPHTVFVSYGAVYTCLFLATGDNENEVQLVRVNSGTQYHFQKDQCTVLTTMRVPHATTTRHAVVFETEDHQTFKIYLDGTLWTTYKFDAPITLGANFQIGGWCGGSNNIDASHPASDGYGYYSQANETTAANASCAAIRIFDGSLGPNAIAALSAEFPYVSPAIPYDRLLETWTGGEDNAWEQSGRWVNHTNDTVSLDVPDTMSAIVLTNGTDAALAEVRTLEINWNQKIESLELQGNGPIVFTSGEGEIECYSKVTVLTDVTNAWDAIDMFGVPLEIAAGKTLVWDLTSYPLEDFGEVTTNQITGVKTGDGNLVLEFPISEMYTFETWFNETDSCYYLVIKPPTPAKDTAGNNVGYVNIQDATQFVITDVTGHDINLSGKEGYGSVATVVIKPLGYDITSVFTNGSGNTATIDTSTKVISGLSLNPNATWTAPDNTTYNVKPNVENVVTDKGDVPPMALTDGGARAEFGINAIPGLWYAIETSADGTNWTVDDASQQQATQAGGLKLTSSKKGDGTDETARVTHYRIRVAPSKNE